MPLYICNAVKGAIPESAKAKIASDITDIHCELTGTPPNFVHAFFFEDAPQQPLNGKSVFLFGNIRKGRTDRQKKHLANRIKESIHFHAGIALGEIMVDTSDIPASWIMKGGHIYPEPGEEEEWLKAHRADVAITG